MRLIYNNHHGELEGDSQIHLYNMLYYERVAETQNDTKLGAPYILSLLRQLTEQIEVKEALPFTEYKNLDATQRGYMHTPRCEGE